MPRWISHTGKRLLALSALAGLGMAPQLSAQPPEQYYFPLNQMTPLGQSAYITGFQHPNEPFQLQAIRVDLPSRGKVTFFATPDRSPATIETTQLARVAPGFVYRLRIAEMPEFPGIELYPTIEILDRLHPPAGQEDDFPVPIALTAEEIDHAINGRLVTKVVYLEQPQIAYPTSRTPQEAVQDVRSEDNLLLEADRRGRPMVIVRLGARQPLADGDNSSFFGPPAPFELQTAAPASSQDTETTRSQN